MVNPTTPPVPTSIAGLPAIPIPPSGSDYIPVSQNGVTYKAAANTLGGTGPTGPAGPPGTVVPWCVAGGSADAITGAFTPAVSALTDGLLLNFRATAANATTTPTFKADSTTAHTITDLGGSALVANAIPAALAECQIRYNLANTRWELMNPANTTTGVTKTGSPSSGNLAKFSGASSITNTDLTGDVTTSGGSATTLATVNSNTGSFTAANITVNGKGLITAASSGTVGIRGNTYQITDTTDITLSQAPTQTNIGSTKAVSIPTKGMIQLYFTGRVIYSTNENNLIVGIRIGSTNYWPSDTSNSLYYGATEVSTPLTSTNTGWGIAFFNEGGGSFMTGMSVEANSIPTGNQTIQVVVAKSLSANAVVIKGTAVASIINIVTVDCS